MGGRWKSSEETRTRILEAAGRVFARAGYFGTSVRAVSQEAGLQLPSLYHHFQNKENLYRAVLETHHAELYDAVRVRIKTDADLRQEVHSLFDAVNAYHRRRPLAIYLIFSLVFNAPENIQQEFAARSGQGLHRLLREAFIRHGVRGDRERLGLLGDILRSFLLGLAAPAMRAGKEINKRRLVDLALGAQAR